MQALWHVLEEQYGKKFDMDPELLDAVLRVSRAFTEGREKLSEDYFRSDDYQNGYAAYFLPMNAAKVSFLLKQNVGGPIPRRILDYGCGPGTASLAFLETFAEKLTAKPLALHLVDLQEDVLNTAAKRVYRLAKMLKIPVEVHVSQELPESDAADLHFDLIMAVNVLNELHSNDSTLERLWSAPLPSAESRRRFLIVEPSHRVSSQRVIRLRKRLLELATQSGFPFRVLGPCLHAAECPVARTDHWCHFSEPIEDERLVKLGRRAFGNSRDWMKYSYLDLARSGSMSNKPHPNPTHIYRAIGDAHPVREGFAIDLCQPKTKFVLTLPKTLPMKEREQLRRGALVKLDPKTKKLLPISHGKRS